VAVGDGSAPLTSATRACAECTLRWRGAIAAKARDAPRLSDRLASLMVAVSVAVAAATAAATRFE
jgi:hypothetical protein